ncbi:Suppressor/Enhancer of Lin-12 [Ditylenchus destructor]|nr:Suppressor/Enhancer of Lin-12 [Ditylenchus destructor]
MDPNRLWLKWVGFALKVGINNRLNDIDLKLAVVLEMFAARLNENNPILPGCSTNGQANSCPEAQAAAMANMAAAVSTLNTLAQATNSSPSTIFSQMGPQLFNSNQSNGCQPNIFSDALANSLTSRLLAACQDGQLQQQIEKYDTNTPSPSLQTGSRAQSVGANEDPSPLSAVTDDNSQESSIQHNDNPSSFLDVRHRSDDDGEGMGDEEFMDDYDNEDELPSSQTPTRLPHNKKSVHCKIEPNTSNELDEKFPNGAVKRAAEKAARSFQSTQPKVFAWQILRESISDEELKNIQISLRTFHGETASHLLSRQLPKVSRIVDSTMKYFKWDQLADEVQLQKAKILLSHLKNNAKVRNWTLREGRPNRSSHHHHQNQNNNPDAILKRYASLFGPNGLNGLASMGILTENKPNKTEQPTSP